MQDLPSGLFTANDEDALEASSHGCVGDDVTLAEMLLKDNAEAKRAKVAKTKRLRRS
jgi:hypothetical protein